MSVNPYHSQYSVPNPAAPFNGDIPNGLHPGRQIFVRGVVSGSAQQFRVDLITSSGDIALHVNPRLNISQVVRNTHRGNWGSEERHGPFPFRRNEGFELVITCEADHFKVSVNGQHQFDYNHRLPLQAVNRLAVLGDVECTNITFVGGFPACRNEIFNPSVPSAVPVVGGFEPGKLVHIVGQVPPSPGRFQVNIQSGPYNEPNDIHLHFNPRWNDPYSPAPITVRTHRHHGGWGGEDRNQPPFPFVPGELFELVILCDQNEWKLAVNGQHYVSYPHNFEFSSADHIGFVGDIVVQSVKQY